MKERVLGMRGNCAERTRETKAGNYFFGIANFPQTAFNPVVEAMMDV
jgi:hypothetical protein